MPPDLDTQVKIIVRDDGFHTDDLDGCEFKTLEQLEEAVDSPICLHLENDTDPSGLPRYFSYIKAVRIPFPDFTDGRGFSLASSIRQMGYGGRLRAEGHVIADQYALARRSGFDEVAIGASLAARQPESHWTAWSGMKRPSYQQHLLKKQ